MPSHESTSNEWPFAKGLGPVREFPSGASIFQQGNPVKNLYFIQKGLVKLTRAEGNARGTLVAVRTDGWLLAAAAGLLGNAHPVTAETITPCELRLMDVGDYQHLVRTDIEIANWVHRMRARQAYEQIVLLGQFGSLRPRQRLEQFLARSIALLIRPGHGTSVRIQLPLKQHEIAQAIGVTPEHLSRLYSKLERDGIICREKGWLIVPAKSALLRRTQAIASLIEDSERSL